MSMECVLNFGDSKIYLHSTYYNCNKTKLWAVEVAIPKRNKKPKQKIIVIVITR